MKTQMNEPPYGDNVVTNYSHIAFRAGRPLQAGELNELQRIQQQQLAAVSGHLFRNGARISGATVRSVLSDYIIVNQVGGGVPSIQPGDTLKNETNGLMAKAIATHGLPNSKMRVEIAYTNAGTSGTVQCFLLGDIITVNSALSYNIEKVDSGIIVHVSDGKFFVNGGIAEVQSQSLWVSDTPNVEDLTVGLVVTERIVTYAEDANLLDSNLQYSNAGLPGADRIFTDCKLAIIDPLTESANVTYITLVIYKFGRAAFILSETKYADLMDMLAKRTFEESGNYTLNTPRVSVFNNNKISEDDATGFKLNGDPTKLTVKISPFAAYVRGYRTETISDTFVDIDKSLSSVSGFEFKRSYNDGTYLTMFQNGGTSSIIMDSSNNSIWEIKTHGGKLYGYVQVFTIVPLSIEYGVISTRYKVYCSKLPENIPSNTDLVFTRLDNGVPNTNAKLKTFIIPGEKSYYFPSRTNLIFNANTVGPIAAFNNGVSLTTMAIIKSTEINAAGVAIFNAPIGAEFQVYGNIPKVFGGKFSGVTGPDAFTGSYTDELFVSADEIRIQTPPGTYDYIFISVGLQYKNLVPITKVLSRKTQIISGGTSYDVGLNHDVLRLVSVVESIPGQPDRNVTELFALKSSSSDINIKPDILYRKNGSPVIHAGLQSGYKLTATYDSFDWSTTGDYVCSTSYDITTGVPYNLSELKKYSSNTGEIFDPLQSIDFRPKLETGQTSTLPRVIIAGSPTIEFDYSCYAGRIDTIAIDTDGNIEIIKGVPALTDKVAPFQRRNQLALGTINIAPGYSNISDHTINVKESRRYTMSDIQGLDNRLSSVEADLALTQLENEAVNLSTVGLDGIPRTKSGILTDAFNTYGGGDVTNVAFKGSYDRAKGVFRPLYTTTSIPLEIEYNNTVQTDTVFIPAHTTVVANEQPISSKSVSLNPFKVFPEKGTLTLFPNVDTWTDTTNEPAITLNLKDAELIGLSGTTTEKTVLTKEWGAWQFSNSTVLASSTNVLSQYVGNGMYSDTKVETSTIKDTFVRIGSETTTKTKTTSAAINVLTSASISPYMRATNIRVAATTMRANCRMFMYIDGIDVTSDCTLIYPNDQQPGVLRTDNIGRMIAIINIKPGKFFAGTKKITLTQAPSFDLIPEYRSYADALFFSGGLDVTQRQIGANVMSQVTTTTPLSSIKTATRIDTIVTPPVLRDPLAQSFRLGQDSIIKFVELFFDAVDTTSTTPVWVEIVTMDNGYPTTTVVARATKMPADIQTSANASVATRFEFLTPAFIEGNHDYAFVVGCDSPDTRIFVAKLGETSKETGATITTQPSFGSSFRSQNAVTWTAEQNEDLKYRIGVAYFDSDTTVVKARDYGITASYPTIVSVDIVQGSNIATINAPGMHAIPGKSIELLPKTQAITINVPSNTKIPIGATVTAGATHKSTVTRIDYTNQLAPVLYLDNLIGSVLTSGTTISIVGNILSNERHDYKMLKLITGQVPDNQISFTTTVNSVEPMSIGIPFGKYTVLENKGPDICTIQTTANASSTRTVVPSTQTLVLTDLTFNNITLSGAYTLNGCTIETSTEFKTWDVPAGTIVSNRSMPSVITHDVPCLIQRASNANTTPHSIVSTLTFKAPSRFVAPIINTTTFSAVAVTDRVLNKSVVQGADAEAGKVDGFIGQSHRYITKTITPSVASRDARLLFDVYKPVGTSFDVYADIGEGWFKLDKISQLANFTSADATDFRTVDVLLSQIYPSKFYGNHAPFASASDILQIYPGLTQADADAIMAGTTPAYSSIKIKVVFYGTNPAKSALLKRFRLITLA